MCQRSIQHISSSDDGQLVGCCADVAAYISGRQPESNSMGVVPSECVKERRSTFLHSSVIIFSMILIKIVLTNERQKYSARPQNILEGKITMFRIMGRYDGNRSGDTGDIFGYDVTQIYKDYNILMMSITNIIKIIYTYRHIHI